MSGGLFSILLGSQPMKRRTFLQGTAGGFGAWAAIPGSGSAAAFPVEGAERRLPSAPAGPQWRPGALGAGQCGIQGCGLRANAAGVCSRIRCWGRDSHPERAASKSPVAPTSGSGGGFLPSRGWIRAGDHSSPAHRRGCAPGAGRMMRRRGAWPSGLRRAQLCVSAAG